MKRFFAIGLVAVFSLLLICCGKKDETKDKATAAPTENSTVAPTESTTVPTETIVPDAGSTVQGEPTEIPLNFQGAGWISTQDAVSLLKTFMGSFDDNGNQLYFTHVGTIYKDGKYFYQFSITSSQVDGSEAQYPDQLVSTDGFDIIEYAD